MEKAKNVTAEGKMRSAKLRMWTLKLVEAIEVYILIRAGMFLASAEIPGKGVGLLIFAVIYVICRMLIAGE